MDSFDDVQDETPLGDAVTESRTGYGAGVLVLGMGLVLVALSALFLTSGSEGSSHQPRRGRDRVAAEVLKVPAVRIGAGLLAAAGGVFFSLAGGKMLARGPEVVEFCERGVRRTCKGKRRAVLYEDAEGVDFGFRPSDRAGVETQLTIACGGEVGTVTLSSDGPEDAAPGGVNPTAAEVSEVRDRAVAGVAKRMKAALARGQNVPWTGGLTLTPAGLDVRGTLVPWAEVDKRYAEESDGSFRIASVTGRPLASGHLTTRNVIPGLAVLGELAGTPAGRVAA